MMCKTLVIHHYQWDISTQFTHGAKPHRISMHGSTSHGYFCFRVKSDNANKSRC